MVIAKTKQQRVYEALTSGRALARELGVSELTVRRVKALIKQDAPDEPDPGRVSPEELEQVIRHLEHGLTFPTNNGAGTKAEIRKALKILKQGKLI